MVIAYCIKCGNKFPQEAVFCPYCGAKVYRPETETATKIEVPVETTAQSTNVNVVEDTAVIDGEIKDFHERLIAVVETKDGFPKTLPKENVVAAPSSDLVKATPEQVTEPTSKEEIPESQSVKPNVENVVEADLPNVDEDLEDPSTGGCIIAFFFPMIGFISALCNIGSNKKKAKRYAFLAAVGLLVGFISGVIQTL